MGFLYLTFEFPRPNTFGRNIQKHRQTDQWTDKHADDDITPMASKTGSFTIECCSMFLAEHIWHIAIDPVRLSMSVFTCMHGYSLMVQMSCTYASVSMEINVMGRGGGNQIDQTHPVGASIYWWFLYESGRWTWSIHGRSWAEADDNSGDIHCLVEI